MGCSQGTPKQVKRVQEEEDDGADDQHIGNLFGPDVVAIPMSAGKVAAGPSKLQNVAPEAVDLELLLGENATALPAGSARTSKAPRSGDASAGLTAQPEPRRHSAAVMRHAAKCGVPLPEDDEGYTQMDAYIDELIGTPDDQRPKNWTRPSFDDAEASLRARQHDIIHADGHKAPAGLEQRLQGREGSDQPVPAVNSIFQGWKDIDAQALPTPKDAVVANLVAPVAGPGPMPKRRAAPATR